MSNQKITCQNGNLQVPNNPIIPFIEGDGTGADIWNASVKVFDAAVEKAYGGTRKIELPGKEGSETKEVACHEPADPKRAKLANSAR